MQKFAEGGDAWPRYPEMLHRLRELQAEAEAARQRERQVALVWIRKAIADYDLSPSELGLR
ncbi:H-NS histone family protein [Aquincola tertiaricarbonis]|uniref:H-NS histone family protein n=1 Tax=Aquincola tertiaricarbonis TaxID=391953 RepID=UPI0012EE7C7E|nr:H-NS histone family protein [Aquincola tertiaricarbonis]